MSYLEAHERLWLRVAVGSGDECWEWQGAINSHGYGTIRDHCLSRGCHVVAHESRVGPVPAGMMVCHTCDNRKCCNPTHLYLGTATDNARDRDNRGRSNTAFGGRCGQAKLDNAKVALIRHLVSCGVKQRKLAALYGVTPMVISNVWLRKSWRHAPDMEVHE